MLPKDAQTVGENANWDYPARMPRALAPVNLNYSSLNDGLSASPLICGIRSWILQGLMNSRELGARLDFHFRIKRRRSEGGGIISDKSLPLIASTVAFSFTLTTLTFYPSSSASFAISHNIRNALARGTDLIWSVPVIHEWGLPQAHRLTYQKVCVGVCERERERERERKRERENLEWVNKEDAKKAKSDGTFFRRSRVSKVE